MQKLSTKTLLKILNAHSKEISVDLSPNSSDLVVHCSGIADPWDFYRQLSLLQSNLEIILLSHQRGIPLSQIEQCLAEIDG